MNGFDFIVSSEEEFGESWDSAEVFFDFSGFTIYKYGNSAVFNALESSITVSFDV
ncbi:MAG: hypothetical protein ACJA1N_002179 [Saprospiraceae bacterium]